MTPVLLPEPACHHGAEWDRCLECVREERASRASWWMFALAVASGLTFAACLAILTDR